MEDPKQGKIDKTTQAGGEPNHLIKEANGFQKVDYGLKEKSKIIEIKIVRRVHQPNEYPVTAKPPSGPGNFHYYIFYANGPDTEIPGKMNELGAHIAGGEFPARHQDQNCTNTGVWPGQRIKWICLYPFTIYFGGTSIITTDEFGWPKPGQIIPYLKAYKKDLDPVKDLEAIEACGQDYYYTTRNAYIVNNVLRGDYKYNVSVYIKEADIICVDDPLNSVPPPT